jgi:S1-C subfamily serine protease
VAGEEVTDNDSLQTHLLEHDPGDEVQIGFVRVDEMQTVQVTLGVRPLPIEQR